MNKRKGIPKKSEDIAINAEEMPFSSEEMPFSSDEMAIIVQKYPISSDFFRRNFCFCKNIEMWSKKDDILNITSPLKTNCI